MARYEFSDEQINSCLPILPQQEMDSLTKYASSIRPNASTRTNKQHTSMSAYPDYRTGYYQSSLSIPQTPMINYSEVYSMPLPSYSFEDVMPATPMDIYYHGLPSTTFEHSYDTTMIPDYCISVSGKKLPAVPNVCPYPECEGQQFVRKGDLHRHLSTIHDPDHKRYPCPLRGCNRRGEYGLPRPDKVLDHIREKHKLAVPKTKKGGQPFNLIKWLRAEGHQLEPEYASLL